MIGWINNSVEAFLKDTFGEQKWLEILNESGQASTYPWVSSCPFTDQITYDLVNTGARVLGVSVDQALEAYGVYFVNYVSQQGYTKLLNVLGGDIVEFLENMNNLHLHLTLAQPTMLAPAFRCSNVTPESVEVHYYSNRPGLWPIVVGALKGVAKEYFKFELEVELLQSRHGTGADHEVFLVKFPCQESIKNRIVNKPILASDPFEAFEVSAALFADLNPFHILMDKQFNMLQCGRVISRLLPDMVPGSHVGEFLKIKMPSVQFKWEEIQRESNGPFLLRTTCTGLELKGQMLFIGLPIPGCPVQKEVLVFIGSPRCANLDDLQKHKLFLSDIPIHDMSGDFVLLAEQRQAEADLKERFEKLTNELKAEKIRSDALVQRMSGLLACFPFKASKGDQQTSSANSDISSSYRDEARDRMDVIEAVRRAMGPIASNTDEEEHIELQQAIGEGSYGKVYRGLWQGTEVAVKTIILPANMSGSEKREKMAIMEAAISSSLSHPNIVQTYTYSIKPMRDSAAAAVAGAAGMSQMYKKNTILEEISRSHSMDLEAAGIVVGGASMTQTTFPSERQNAPLAPPTSLQGIPCHPSGVNIENNASAAAAGTAGTAAATAGTAGTAAATAAEVPPPSNASPEIKKIGNGSVGTDGGGGAIHSYEIRLVLEFCDQGSLKDILDEHWYEMPDGSLNYKAILDTALDIAKAMLHLHRNNVLHADLKARNVLLRSGGDSGKGFVAKVADFGLSVKMDEMETHMSDMCQGTLTHMAPELMLEGQVSKPADVYAFGILMWELFTAGSPYKGTPRALLGHQVTVQDKRPPFPPHTPAAFRTLAQNCWAKDPKARPLFEEVLQSLLEMRKAEAGRTTSAVMSTTGSHLHFEEGDLGDTNKGILPKLSLGGVATPSPAADGSMDYGSAIVGEVFHTGM